MVVYFVGAILQQPQFSTHSEQTKPTEKRLGLFNEAEHRNKPDSKEAIKKDARGYHIICALLQIFMCERWFCSSHTFVFIGGLALGVEKSVHKSSKLFILRFTGA